MSLVPLSGPELLKYEWRLELFLDKLAKKDPFTLVDGTTQAALELVNATPDDVRRLYAAYDKAALTKLQLRRLDTGEIITLRQLGKSAEFGGGAGTNVGTTETKRVEILTGAHIVAALNFGVDFAAIDTRAREKILEKAAARGFLRAPAPPGGYRVDENESYRDSYAATAALFANNFSGSDWYVYYVDQPEIKEIYAAAKAAAARTSGVKLNNINRWSTADIWMARGASTAAAAAAAAAAAEDIYHLNQILSDFARDKTFFGISLKKITASRGQLTWMNVGDSDSYVASSAAPGAIERIHLGKTFFSFAGFIVYLTNYSVECRWTRAATSISSWMFNVRARSQHLHLHGSIAAYDVLLKYIPDAIISDPWLSDIHEAYLTLRRQDAPERDALMNRFYDVYVACRRVFSDLSAEPALTRDEFIAEVNAIEPHRANARYATAAVALAISKMTPDQQQKMFADIIKRAKGQEDFSAPFLLVSA